MDQSSVRDHAMEKQSAPVQKRLSIEPYLEAARVFHGRLHST